MSIQSENEAIVAILISAIAIDDELSEFEIDKVSNALGLCIKFKGLELKETFRKVLTLKNEYGSVELIRMSVPYVEEPFMKTLYAIVCDILCSDGNTSDTDIQLMAFVASELHLPEEVYLPIATSFMTRYIWNVPIE
jgi:hypothetical protein